MDPMKLAMDVMKRWVEITGMPEEEMDEEQEFPQVVIDYVTSKGVDYQDFCDVWSTIRG